MLVEDELVDIAQISEDLYSSALIHRGGLDEPHVVLAVLYRHAFFLRASSGDFLVAGHQQVNFIVVADSRNNKGCRRGVENGVVSLLCSL